MRAFACLVSGLFLTALSPGAISAQTIRSTEWSHGTTLSGFVGSAVDGDRNGPVAGGAVAWEMTPRFALEGSGGWTTFGDASSAFEGAMTLQWRIAGHRHVDPFLLGGIGLYRAVFDDDQVPMPEFYKDRMGGRRGLPDRATFTDPTLLGGGGVSLYLSQRLALRPQAGLTLVFRDGRQHTVGNLVLHVVYHFENHPVTPVAKR
jgi:hypothetical protein